MPLINCEKELDLRWSRNCLLLEDGNITRVSFTITKVCLKKSDSGAKKINNFLSAKAMKLIFVLMCKY